MRAGWPSVLLLGCVCAFAAALGGATPGGRTAPLRAAAGSAPKLFLAGDGELWVVEVGTSKARRLALPELGPGDAPYRILARGRRLVLWGYTTYLLDPSNPSRLQTLVDRSLFFIPSSHRDRVWVTFVDRASPDTVRALRAVREVGVDGKTTVREVHPPHGRWPLAAVDRGLLFSSGPQRLELWDPRTGLVVRQLRIDRLGPTHRDLIAACDGACRRLRLVDAGTGTARSIGLPDGFTGIDVEAGAFSPDGTLLAVPLERGGAAGFAAAHRLALIDVAHGRVSVIAGSQVPSGYTFTAWSARGDYVFITGGDRFEQRVIVAYRLGAKRASAVPVEVGDFFGLAAV